MARTAITVPASSSPDNKPSVVEQPTLPMLDKHCSMQKTNSSAYVMAVSSAMIFLTIRIHGGNHMKNEWMHDWSKEQYNDYRIVHEPRSEMFTWKVHKRLRPCGWFEQFMDNKFGFRREYWCSVFSDATIEKCAAWIAADMLREPLT
jgi:hypothetical protein